MPTSYHAFVDESGQRDYGARTDPYYVVAAAIAPEDAATQYSTEFRGLKRAFFSDSDVEIKSNWLRQPAECSRRYLAPYGITERKLASFVDALYDWIGAAEITFIAGVLDKPQMQRQYTHPHYPSPVAYQVFLQRFQKYLAQRHADGEVTCDLISGTSPGGLPWQTLLARHHGRLKRNGCNYTGIQFLNVGANVHFADSSDCQLLQIADLAAYNVFRQFRDYGVQWDDPLSKSLSLYTYFARLLPRFHHDASKVFEGFGVAKMPTQARHRWMIP